MQKRNAVIIIISLLFLSLSVTVVKENTMENFLYVFVISEFFGLVMILLINLFIINPLLKTLQETKNLSEHDKLTGICNRTRFYKRVEFYNRCESIGVVFIDVNDLKKTNDIYGHDAGDELIREVAKEIRNLGKKYRMDYYRFGGDEFIVVLPNSTLETLVEMERDLFDHVKQIELKLAPIQCSVAMGKAFKDINIDIEYLIKKADERMYAHKNKQRNKK